MKKTISLIICLLIMMVSLTSCSTANDNSKTAKDISMFDLKEAMADKAEFGEMLYNSSSDSDAEDLFASISDYDYSKVKQWFAYYAASGKESADEIVVIEAKDSADVSGIKQSLQDHLDYRISLYKTYGPEQIPKLEKAVLFTSGNYAVLIIADNPSEIRTAFDNFISK